MKKRYQIIILFCIIILTTLSFYIYNKYFSDFKNIHDDKIPDVSRILEENQKKLDMDISAAKEELVNIVNKFIEKYKDENLEPKYPPSIYFRDKNGVLADHKHKALSNIYVFERIKYDDDLKRYITATEYLEPLWEQIYRKHDNYAWLYTYYIKTTTIRCYPWFDFSKNFGPETDFKNLIAYKLGLHDVNPQRIEMCTDLYNDLGGMGVMISCAKPIDMNGEHIATALIDIKMRKFLEDIAISLRFLPEFYFFATNKNNEFMFSVRINKFTDFSNVSYLSNIFNEEIFSDIKESITKYLVSSSNKPYFKFKIRNGIYNLFLRDISEINWKIGVLYQK